MKKKVTLKDINKLLERYLKDIESELTERWNQIIPTIEDSEFIEVVAGLLSRQVSITNYYIKSPLTWNGDIGTIILRTICENVINLSWILKDDSLNRARMFIMYGLGQEKLQLEHRKSEIKTRNATDEENEMLEIMEESLNRERYTFLTDVNLGSWSEKSILKIAEESDCIDFYHFVFTPFSNSAHGTWNHLMKYSLKASTNPMHNNIKRPIFLDLRPDIHFAELAMKYLSKAFDRFDKHFKLEDLPTDSYDKYLSNLDSLLLKTQD
jgi:hypothetical protein